MKIFVIIVFGLATLRTLMPFAKRETYYNVAGELIPTLIISGTMVWAYIWILDILVN